MLVKDFHHVGLKISVFVLCPDSVLDQKFRNCPSCKLMTALLIVLMTVHSRTEIAMSIIIFSAKLSLRSGTVSTCI